MGNVTETDIVSDIKPAGICREDVIRHKRRKNDPFLLRYLVFFINARFYLDDISGIQAYLMNS